MTNPEYDPFSYELDQDPYPTYRWMRDHAPAYRNERLDFWAFTRFQDNYDALVDPITYSSSHGTSLEFMDTPKPGTGLMIWMDPPRHTRYRKLVSKAFTPARIGELEPMIRRIACEYLDPLVGRPRFDAVKEFTARLPMDVISTMLGIPEADRLEVQRRSNLMLHREPGNPMPTQEAIGAQIELMKYVTELIADRRSHPKQDLMTRLVEVELDEDGERTRLSDDDIRMFFSLLATAGNETVTKLLATAFHELWKSPEQRRILVADPSLIPNAVEETLRFDPPSQYQGRVTTRAVELHGERSRRVGRCSSSTAPRAATNASSKTRTATTYAARSTSTSASATAATSAWAPSSRAWSRRSRSRSSCGASPTTKSRRTASSACTRATCAASRASWSNRA